MPIKYQHSSVHNLYAYLFLSGMLDIVFVCMATKTSSTVYSNFVVTQAGLYTTFNNTQS